jgi:hypothetical protein
MKGFHKEMWSEGTKISSKRYIATVFTYLVVFLVIVSVFNIDVEKSVDGRSFSLHVNEDIIKHIVDALLMFIATAIGITAAVSIFKKDKEDDITKRS